MRSASIVLAAVVALLCVMPCSARAQQAAPLSIAEYVNEIDRLAVAVQQLDPSHLEGLAHLRSQVPSRWTIATRERTWTMSADWLRHDLDAWQAHPDAATLERLSAHLTALRDTVRSADADALDPAESRRALARVLSSPEFRDASGPSWVQIQIERLVRWLIGFLGNNLAVPTFASSLIYAFIVLAVLGAAWWMFVALRQSASDDRIALTLPFTAERSWPDWLADARAANAAGDWRQSVRLSYWCAIAFLESKGAWRADPSRTPREYLRLLRSTDDAQQTLRELTRLLERVWYAADRADAATFEDALAQLRRLGCPLP